MMEREAFQEIDYRQMFGPMAKWVAQIDDARRIPEFISRAFFTATSGRPGPVVLALPEDMLTDTAEVPDAPPYTPLPIAPDAHALRQFHALLSEAKKPFLIVGGGGWSDTARRDLEAFAAAHEVPVGVSFRCQDYFDNLHPCYGGHIGIGLDAKIADRIRNSDLVIALGARLGEATTAGYTLFDIPKPRQPLVHVYPDPEEIGRVYSPTLGVVASSAAFAAAIRRLEPKHRSRAGYVKAAHADYLAFAEPTRSPGDVQLSQIVRGLSDRLPHRHHHLQRRRQLCRLGPSLLALSAISHRTGADLGFDGLWPACGRRRQAAASRTHGDLLCRRRLFPDDGLEFMTAVENRLPLIVIVCNNGMYGTIRMHQEREYPGRVSGTDLANPDFAALARACGGFGARVERTEDFARAFDEAVARGFRPIIELTISPEALTPAASLSETRAKAMAAKGRYFKSASAGAV